MANPLIRQIAGYVPGSTTIQQVAAQAVPVIAVAEAVTVETVRGVAGWVKAVRANLGV